MQKFAFWLVIISSFIVATIVNDELFGMVTLTLWVISGIAYISNAAVNR